MDIKGKGRAVDSFIDDELEETYGYNAGHESQSTPWTASMERPSSARHGSSRHRIIAWLHDVEATARAVWTTGCLKLRYYHDGSGGGLETLYLDDDSEGSKMMPFSGGSGNRPWNALMAGKGLEPGADPISVTPPPRRRHSHPILSRRKLGSLISTLLILCTPVLLVLCVRSMVDVRRREESIKRFLGEEDALERGMHGNQMLFRRSADDHGLAAALPLSTAFPPSWLTEGDARYKDELEALARAPGRKNGRLLLGLGLWRDENGSGANQEILQRRSRRDAVGEGSVKHTQELPFWGNSDVVGASPFDHVPQQAPDAEIASGGQPRRLLFLTDYHDYLERMNTHTYELVDAALRHPLIDVDVWGPKWKHWNASLSVAENVRRRSWAGQETGEALIEENMSDAGVSWAMGSFEGCPARPFDLVFTVSNIFDRQDPKLGPLGCGSLFIQQLGDCHELRCTDEWYPHATNITVSKYAFEIPELFDHQRTSQRFPGLDMQLFAHSPDSANPWDFWPLAWEDKVADARVFGFDGSFYPLRTTVTQNLDRGNIIDRFQHPGYTISTDRKLYDEPLETYTHGHESYATHRDTRESFARGMRESRICVFDASLERKLIRKYAQALLSGCVIAGDLPTEHEDALSDVVIRLDPNWSFERISEEIERALADPDELRRKALLGFAYARRYLTITHKFSSLLRVADRYREGARGYDLTFPFSLRCRAYWSDEDAYRPPWCKGVRGLEG